jgi:hypothetical protein
MIDIPDSKGFLFIDGGLAKQQLHKPMRNA